MLKWIFIPNKVSKYLRVNSTFAFKTFGDVDETD